MFRCQNMGKGGRLTFIKPTQVKLHLCCSGWEQSVTEQSYQCFAHGKTSIQKCIWGMLNIIFFWLNNCYSCNNYFLGIYKTKSFLFCDKGPILTPWSGNKMALWYTELALSKTFWRKNLATIGFGVLTFPSNGPLEVQTWLQWTSALITKSKVPIFMKVKATAKHCIFFCIN